MIKIIVATCMYNRVIGKEGALPWDHPEDLKRFKKLTMGDDLLMGRKTFASILKKNGKPLPGRKHLVCSKAIDFASFDGQVLNIGDLNTYMQSEIIDEYKGDDKNLWIIGGGEIYKQSLKYADEIYVSVISRYYEGDAFFPDIDRRYWRLAGIEKDLNDPALFHMRFIRQFESGITVCDLMSDVTEGVMSSLFAIRNELHVHNLPLTHDISESLKKVFYEHYKEAMYCTTDGEMYTEEVREKLFIPTFEKTLSKLNGLYIDSDLQSPLIKIYMEIHTMLTQLIERIRLYVSEQAILTMLEEDNNNIMRGALTLGA